MQLLYVFPQRVAFVVRAARPVALATSEKDLGTSSMLSSTAFARPVTFTRTEKAPSKGGNRTAAINIRCLEGIDLDSVPVQHFDGRSL
jgi:hypothetical protein